ncbi:cAMP-activated global transcriptional regulator CRP [Crenothrix polyspora]|jgi:CRP/FNR family transcriptional regulator, cyclic AMP receptor protein|uniref:DNA-binding transcriptional dual regulator n=1 Tax=Crenothrix polyspora TaxID=360316 RepID=A0A1R4HD32_9GAMM|nr:cAMP-activated global transcriptional regulator CRP [Crenothrix polyspora]SJM94155.1 DNA-binding transcriptional dual regulator [Crenothrix polyspora]
MTSLNEQNIENSLPLYEEPLDQFLKYCHKKHYFAKAIVIQPGDTGDYLYFIIDGSVSIYAEDKNTGQELVLAYLNKNEFIGEIGVFKNIGSRKVTVKTRTVCYLAEIKYARLHQLLKKELRECAATLLYILGSQLANRLLLTSRNLCDLAFMDVEGRVARTLLDLCKEPDAITHPHGMQLHITRQEIARIVGCSREMAGRVLKELEDKKLITAHGKTIVVLGVR